MTLFPCESKGANWLGQERTDITIMQKKESVSMPVIRRLPRYYRFLNELRKNGVTRVSSKELSEKMGATASQIRQDLNCFGGFGQQGYGYNVPQLCDEIGKILGLQSRHRCVLIGAGNLGRAITAHMPFRQLGFDLIGVFDNSPRIIGTQIGGQQVLDYGKIEGFVRENSPVMAILCVPAEAVRSISNDLYTLGIRAFWNFSHYDISLEHPDIIVENVHMNDSMMTLCYKLSQQKEPAEKEASE